MSGALSNFSKSSGARAPLEPLLTEALIIETAPSTVSRWSVSDRAKRKYPLVKTGVGKTSNFDSTYSGYIQDARVLQFSEIFCF